MNEAKVGWKIREKIEAFSGTLSPGLLGAVCEIVHEGALREKNTEPFAKFRR